MIDKTTEDRIRMLENFLSLQPSLSKKEKLIFEDLKDDLKFLDDYRNNEASQQSVKERTLEVDEMIEGKTDAIIIKKLDE